jgi:catechol 2,3-dioxygenase-like lactoylglutathione lyase family enzyme
MSILFTRREALAMMAAAPADSSAQGPSQLPAKTSGLEHVGFTAPDPQKSSTFYGRIFDPQIFQEMMPPLRYYCRLGIGYVAFGPNPTANPTAAARIDHFCATVEDYTTSG